MWLQGCERLCKVARVTIFVTTYIGGGERTPLRGDEENVSVTSEIDEVVGCLRGASWKCWARLHVRSLQDLSAARVAVGEPVLMTVFVFGGRGISTPSLGLEFSRAASIALVSRGLFFTFRAIFHPFAQFRPFFYPDFSFFRFFSIFRYGILANECRPCVVGHPKQELAYNVW